jgi:signal transduction histidine kinase
VRNLIENAVRYGYGAKVSVLSEEGHALIRVEDEGPGIAANKIDEAFQPFVRLEPSRSGETGGIGLGLAIARSIVAAHGGTLTLSNLSIRGLRAEVALPVV